MRRKNYNTNTNTGVGRKDYNTNTNTGVERNKYITNTGDKVQIDCGTKQSQSNKGGADQQTLSSCNLFLYKVESLLSTFRKKS